MKHKKINIELGNRIREARLAANLTQAEMHELTGISITQLSNYENGSRNIGIENLTLIAKAANKTIDEIYLGSSSKKPIVSSVNIGELIVNCIAALFENDVIGLLPHGEVNENIYDELKYSYRLAFKNHIFEIEDLVKKLEDFETNKENYKEPDKFKKQIMDAKAFQINKVKNKR